MHEILEHSCFHRLPMEIVTVVTDNLIWVRCVILVSHVQTELTVPAIHTYVLQDLLNVMHVLQIHVILRVNHLVVEIDI